MIGRNEMLVDDASGDGLLDDVAVDDDDDAAALLDCDCD